MKFIMRVAIRLFTVMVLFSSVMMIIFVFHHVRLDKVFNLLAYVYFDKTLCMFFAALTGFVVLMNFVCFCQILSAVTYEKKIIAFDNPAGRVSVSLTAIEELTKRVISQTSEVREVKSKISVSPLLPTTPSNYQQENPKASNFFEQEVRCSESSEFYNTT